MMSSFRRTSLVRRLATAAGCVGAFVGLLLGAGAATAQAGASTAGESSLTIRQTTEVGKLVKEHAYTESNGLLIEPSRNSRHVSLTMSGGFTGQLTFVAPKDEALVAGKTYLNAGETRAGARLYIDGTSIYCWSGLSAAFRIGELQYDEATRELTHFTAVFQIDCQPEGPEHTYYVGSVAYEPSVGAESVPAFGELTGQVASAVSFAFRPDDVLYSQTAVASGVVREKGGDGIGGVKVALMRQDQYNWKEVDSAITNRSGSYSFRFEARTKNVYRAVVPMGDKVLPSQSFKDKLNVHEKVIAKLDDYRVKPGEPTVLSGKIFPDRNDQHMSAQVKTPDGWKNFLSRDCRRDASFSVRIQAANVGRYKIRVFSQGKDNVMSGVSDVMTLEVRR